MQWAAMPKASIYEHCHFFASENKIRFSHNLLVPAPTTNAVQFENTGKLQLRIFIAG
jgi:hypothetical protein